jgi:hypothetical protein
MRRRFRLRCLPPFGSRSPILAVAPPARVLLDTDLRVRAEAGNEPRVNTSWMGASDRQRGTSTTGASAQDGSSINTANAQRARAGGQAATRISTIRATRRRPRPTP